MRVWGMGMNANRMSLTRSPYTKLKGITVWDAEMCRHFNQTALERFTDWINDFYWLTDGFIDWLIGCLAACLGDWIDWSINRMVGWMIGWLDHLSYNSPPQTFSFVTTTILFSFANEVTVMTSWGVEAIANSSLLLSNWPIATTITWTPFFFKRLASEVVMLRCVEIPSVMRTRNFGTFGRDMPPKGFSTNILFLASRKARSVLVPPLTYSISSIALLIPACV